MPDSPPIRGFCRMSDWRSIKEAAGKDADMGRARYHYHHHRYRHRPPFGRPLVPLLILCAAMLAAAAVAGAAVIAVLVVLGPFVLAGVGTVVVIRHLGRRHLRAVRRRRGEPVPARASAPPVSKTPPVPDWQASRTRFAQL